MAEQDFSGKRILVTGAGSGIGKGVALRLAELGAEVYGVSKTLSNLEALQKENQNVKIVCVDISDWEGTKEALERLPPMDGCVHSAGTGDQALFHDTSPDLLDKIYTVNFKSIVNISQVVTKKMIEAGIAGSVVAISSQASLVPLPRHTAYGTIKAALDHLVRTMALELGPKQIRTNAVNPTVTKTDMFYAAGWDDPVKAGPMLSRIPLGKFAEVKDVVDPVVFLLGEGSKMINGITLPIDGGFSAC